MTADDGELRLTPVPSVPREPWNSRDKTMLSTGATMTVLGLGALSIFSEHLARWWSRPPLFIGVLLAALGPAIALSVLVVPTRKALNIRPALVGIAAAWLSIELAGAARRMGIVVDSGWFRVLWAPIVEEASKALFLAAILDQIDRDKSRKVLVTYGVLVGAGFAFRENVVYFATAIDGSLLNAQWLLLRAIPPACAHMFFGATYATIFAQAVIHERALERPSPRWSMIALLLSTLAHITYNGIPWLVSSMVADWLYPFAWAWSLLALAATFAVKVRVAQVALEDPEAPTEPIRTFEPINRATTITALVLLALWLVPLALPRYIAVVFTPFALGCLLCAGVERLQRFSPYLLWVILGISIRPFFSMSEAALSAIAVYSHSRLGALVAGWAGTALWSFASVFAGYWLSKKLPRSQLPLAMVGMTMGVLAANIGGNLAASPQFAPWRELVGTVLRLVPRTVSLALLIAVASHRRVVFGLVLAFVVPFVAVVTDRLIGRFALAAAIGFAVGFSALFGALMWSERRRSQLAQ